jgi:lipopolysaccharide transport system permease protein
MAVTLLSGMIPRPSVLAVFLFLALALLAGLAFGIWLAALNVRYRDVRHTIPFLVQIWFFATPVTYPAGIVKGPLHLILALNPMTSVVDGARWAVLGTRDFDLPSLTISTTVTLVVLVGGLYFFRRMERSFADVV